ncbi:MAG: hypothetical protein KatS3mg110_1011 [Pirellulaceae bacterium]|nr:MAG: hypothetical protein KatS3mg110_1011 [Pirellulaceae bacterium]
MVAYLEKLFKSLLAAAIHTPLNAHWKEWAVVFVLVLLIGFLALRSPVRR